MSLKIAKELWNISLHTQTNKLDNKHSEIVENAKKIEFYNLCQNFRNWESQSDSGIPFQLNLYNFKSYGFLKYLKFLLAKIRNFIIYQYDEVDYFYDDIFIIKLINGFDILKKCPVHNSPGNNLAFFINKDISANVRWLRYIYFVAVIRNNIFPKSDPKIVLDIGSYYGGFQYVMKKIYKNSKHILVDFPHQLARSAIFLGKSFPKSNIFAIYNEETLENYFKNENLKQFDFLLLSNDLFEKFSNKFSQSDQRIDLFTNFYSFGEMPKIYFKQYLSSAIINQTKYLYFCNRYDSSPFYEKTYHESYSLLDYIIEGFKINLNRSSAIHNYMMPIRSLYGRKIPRPISAGYFELIQENKF